MKNDVTLKNGYWYFFENEDDKIAVWGSAWSGKECIYINDVLVSEKRNLNRFNSSHQFEIGTNQYETLFLVSSIWKAAIECIVIKDGLIIGRDTKAFMQNVKYAKWIGLIFFAAGIITGFLTAYFSN